MKAGGKQIFATAKRKQVPAQDEDCMIVPKPSKKVSDRSGDSSESLADVLRALQAAASIATTPEPPSPHVYVSAQKASHAVVPSQSGKEHSPQKLPGGPSSHATSQALKAHHTIPTPTVASASLSLFKACGTSDASAERRGLVGSESADAAAVAGAAATTVRGARQAPLASVGDSAFGTQETTLREMLKVLNAHPSGGRAQLVVMTARQLLESARQRGLLLSHVFPCSEFDGYFYAVHD